jgi:hypothetical protein
MHNLFSRQLSASEKRRLVISPGHLGKTFRVHRRESGLSGRLLLENDDRPRSGRIADSNSTPKAAAFPSHERSNRQNQMPLLRKYFGGLDLTLCSCVCYVVSMSVRREQKHYFFGFAL